MNGETIIFKSLSGSRLYGTDNENSDMDIKGVFLPDKKDLLLNKAPKHYQISTGNDGEKNNKEDIDETYYSLHYFLELATKGETNAVDLLFAYTNHNAIILNTDKWYKIISNIDKIITKNIKSYLGYCKNQSIRYSIRGDKLNNYRKFKDFCERHTHDIDKNGKRLSIKEIFIDLLGDFEKYIPEPGKERIKFNRIDFGEHCYIETAWNGESYISISDKKIDLNDNVMDAVHKIMRTIESYGKRSENAASDNGADYKAISHCVRVICQVEELLTTNKITFPLKKADFIKSIKYKTTSMNYNEIMEWIDEHIKNIEDNLLPKSTLREKADYKWIENFILSCYE